VQFVGSEIHHFGYLLLINDDVPIRFWSSSRMEPMMKTGSFIQATEVWNLYPKSRRA
jgi:hypothetical protein